MILIKSTSALMNLSICNYPCEKCGSCCKNLSRSSLYKELDHGDGICIYFQQSTNHCTIYEERPILCNIDKMYELFYKNQFSKEEYYEINQSACKILRLNQG